MNNVNNSNSEQTCRRREEARARRGSRALDHRVTTSPPTTYATDATDATDATWCHFSEESSRLTALFFQRGRRWMSRSKAFQARTTGIRS